MSSPGRSGAWQSDQACGTGLVKYPKKVAILPEGPCGDTSLISKGRPIFLKNPALAEIIEQ